MIEAHVIYGPPGTGKTTELLRRVEQAVARGISRDRISYTSFTRAAAAEALSRLNLKSSKKVCTLHALVYRLLRLTKQQVVDDEKLIQFGQEAGIPISGANATSEKEMEIGDEFLAIEQYAVARNIDPVDVWNRSRPASLPWFRHFLQSYKGWKQANGFVDFNDMLVRYAANPIDLGADVLFIDEAQDMSCLQWSVIDKMVTYVREVHVAGDDDQAIYEWSGAFAPGMAEFEQKYSAQRTVLANSFRLPRSVYRVGDKIVAGISQRVRKEFHPRDVDGSVTRHSFISSVDFDDRSTLVLYRNHAVRRELESVLISNRIPYESAVGRPAPLQTRYASAIRTFLALQRGEDVKVERLNNMKSLLRTPAPPLPLILKGRWQHTLDIPPYLYHYLIGVDLEKTPNVRLGSIHSAKGREADRVILYTGMTRRTIESMLLDPDAEARVWYVGVTRAREELHIVEGWNGYEIPTT